MSQHVCRKGFTLVELLVVMAIVALLAAIGYPAYFSMRETAQSAACKGNLKAIGAGFQFYHTAWGGRLPRCDTGSGHQDEHKVPWKMALSRFMGGYDPGEKSIPLHKAFTDPTRGDAGGVYMASRGQLQPVRREGTQNADGMYGPLESAEAEKQFVDYFHRQPSSEADYKWIHNRATQLAQQGGAYTLRAVRTADFCGASTAAIVGPTADPAVHYGFTQAGGLDPSHPERIRSVDQIDFRHSNSVANILFLDSHVTEYARLDTFAVPELLRRWNCRELRLPEPRNLPHPPATLMLTW